MIRKQFYPLSNFDFFPQSGLRWIARIRNGKGLSRNEVQCRKENDLLAICEVTRTAAGRICASAGHNHKGQPLRADHSKDAYPTGELA